MGEGCHGEAKEGRGKGPCSCSQTQGDDAQVRPPEKQVYQGEPDHETHQQRVGGSEVDAQLTFCATLRLEHCTSCTRLVHVGLNLVVDLMVKYGSRINSLASGINKWK